MKKVAIIGTLVAIVGCIASAIAFFHWLTRQMDFLPADFEDTDFLI